MPITSLRLHNFKGFSDSGLIPISPLTVIFGRNNVGKSTLLQSLLVLRQTLDSSGYESRLNLRGPLFSAGTYSDLVHEHKTSLDVGITIGLRLPGESAASVFLEYTADEPRPPTLGRLRVEGEDIPSLEIRRGLGRGGPFELCIAGRRIGGEKKANFSFPVHGLFPLIGNEPTKIGRPNEQYAISREHARKVLQYLEKQLSDLRALGPFRFPPQRRYEFAGYLRNAIDSEGRNVVDALIDDMTKRSAAKGRLIEEVNRWLRVVGRVRLLPFRRLSRTGRLFELRLRDLETGRWANFADVGSGIGQAFPVFVEGLRTPVSGTFLVQEPEIHLHPDAQLAMGDFLFGVAATGRTVIAETHSESMLLRIRRRAIEGSKTEGDLSHKQIGILYVDHDENKNSIVRALEMDEAGQIKDWPRGFMEDATKERLELLKEMGEV